MILKSLSLLFLISLMGSCYYYGPVVSLKKSNYTPKTDLLNNKVKKDEHKKKPSLKSSLKNLKKDEQYKLIGENKTVRLLYEKQDSTFIYGKKYKLRDYKRKDVKVEKEGLKKIKQRTFSRLRTDILTISTYGAIGATVYILLTK